MPLQNRVDPFAEIHAVPARGTFMGNRGGCFHNDDQTLKRTRWASRAWITCLLQFKGRRRKLMQPKRYTELFFLDEATAFAAGHRPCYECRRADATAFRDALIRAGEFDTPPLAPILNDAIAGEVQSVLKGKATRETVNPASLPDGAIYAVGERAFLKRGRAGKPWSFDGYGPAEPLPDTATRLTPRSVCAALSTGYLPVLHPSAAA